MKNDKEFKIKLVLLWVFAFSVMIFIMSLTAKASEPYFPMTQNENDTIPQSHIDIFNSYLDVENNYYFIYKGEQFIDGVGYFYVSMPKSYENAGIYGEINQNGYQFSLYLIGQANLTNGRISITYNGDVYHNVYNQWPFTNFQNLNSSKYDSNISYVSNFKVYSTNTELSQLVLGYGADDPIINVGVAVIPPGAFIPEYLTGDTPPQNVPPEYTVNNYTWTTAPQFDGSTVINGIQSIKNTLDWLSSNLHEELANLLNNIKGLATYIGKTIQYYGNAIIETMNNAIQNLYENFVALLEPIVQKVNEISETITEIADLFIHPFDAEEFEEQMESCELINQYEELMDNCEVIQQIFDYAEERDYFVLYIDFENPFADSEHKIIHSQISFNWLVPLRSVYRPFLWTFTLFECFVGGMRILGNIIGGKAK